MMEFSAQQIAEILQGSIEGDAEVKVSNFSKIEEGQPGTLTFLANLKYVHYIYETNASIVLVNRDFSPEKALPSTLTLIRVENAYAALAVLMGLIDRLKQKKTGIHPMSCVSDSANYPAHGIYIGAFAYVGDNVRLGQQVQIYPQAYIGDNVTIGDHSIIYPGATIYADCVVGNNCIIHSGAVIGADGFGFAPEGETYKKIPQLGNVVIEDDVEIGANTTIDRAVMGSTIIRSGVKLDNLVQIAHNVEVGENTVMAAQGGISGSTKIGRNNMFGGQVGLAGHIKTGDNVKIGAKSGIISNIENNRSLLGYPAMEIKRFYRTSIILQKLPDMYQTMNLLQKEIAELKDQLKK